MLKPIASNKCASLRERPEPSAFPAAIPEKENAGGV